MKLVIIPRHAGVGKPNFKLLIIGVVERSKNIFRIVWRSCAERSILLTRSGPGLTWRCKNAVNFQLGDPYATPRRGLCLHDLLVSQFVSFPTYPTSIEIFAWFLCAVDAGNLEYRDHWHTESIDTFTSFLCIRIMDRGRGRWSVRTAARHSSLK